MSATTRDTSSAASGVELIVIVCGDRNWRARQPIRELLVSLPGGGRTVVITGAARGADDIAHGVCVGTSSVGHRAISVPAPWEWYDKAAGPIRNQWMLDLLLALRAASGAACHVHAFHDDIDASKGTADMVRRARKAGVAVTVHTNAKAAVERAVRGGQR